MAGELNHIIPTHPSDSQWRASKTKQILYVEPNGTQHNIKAVYWSDSNAQTHLIWLGNVVYHFANCGDGGTDNEPAFIFNVTKAAFIKTITVYTKKSFSNIDKLILAKYDDDIDTIINFRNTNIVANNSNFSIASSTLCDFKTVNNENVYETVFSYNDNNGLVLDEGNYYLTFRFDYTSENYYLVYDNITDTKARISHNFGSINTNVGDAMWTQSHNPGNNYEEITNEFVKYSYTSSPLQWEENPFDNSWVEWDLYDETKNELSWNTYSYYPSHTDSNKKAVKINNEINWYRLYGYGRSYKNNISSISASTQFAPDGMRFASVETFIDDSTHKGGYRYPYNDPDDQSFKSCIDTYQYTQVNKFGENSHYPFILYTPTANCKLVSISYFNHHNLAENAPQNKGVIELDSNLRGVSVLGDLTDNRVTYYKKTNVIVDNSTSALTLYKHYRLPTTQINLEANKTYAISISNEYDTNVTVQSAYSRYYQYYRTNAVNVDNRHYTVCKVDPWNPTSNPVTSYSYSAYAIVTTAAL